MTRLSILLIFPLWYLLTATSFAQGGEKEIIIIEKTVDAQGNVISQQTKRMSGHYSEEELQEMIDEDNGADIRSFDLEGLGFGGDMRDFFGSRKQKPTIGVNLDFNDGQAKVAKVYAYSGASEADIRIGDVLISIDRIPISTIEDVQEVLSLKSSEDHIQVLIFRDGQEIEKEITLGSSQSGLFSFDFPEGGTFRTEEFGMPMDLDSIFENFFDLKGLSDNFRGFGDDPRNNNPITRQRADQRPSLGIFIDDVGTQVIIADVVPDSPADKFGLQKGDVILTIDRNIVTSFREVNAFMNKKKLGDTISLEIDRKGKVFTEDILLN